MSTKVISLKKNRANFETALIVTFSWNLVSSEIPQPFDYVGIGFHLDCYECHSNRPGCGKDVDWILSRWKPCLMAAPKCVKIIERYEGKLSAGLGPGFGRQTVCICSVCFFPKVKRSMWEAAWRRSRWPARTYQRWETTAAGQSTASMLAGAATFLCLLTRPFTASAMSVTVVMRRWPSRPRRNWLLLPHFWSIWLFMHLTKRLTFIYIYTALGFFLGLCLGHTFI